MLIDYFGDEETVKRELIDYFGVFLSFLGFNHCGEPILFVSSPYLTSGRICDIINEYLTIAVLIT